MTTCQCGGKLYRFDVPANVRGVDQEKLPTVCRRCGEIRIAGKIVALPAEFGVQAAKMAEEAARYAGEAREGLVNDPDARVEKYFDNVYRAGYAAGFVRAAAFFSHENRQGRIRRLRVLWHNIRVVRLPGLGGVSVGMAAEEYAEFDQLINIGAPRGNDGKDPEDVGPAG